MQVDLEKYYENYFDLFMLPGWKQFLEEITQGLEALNLENSKDWDSFLVTKTRREQLNNLLRFEELIRIAYDREKAVEEFEHEVEE